MTCLRGSCDAGTPCDCPPWYAHPVHAGEEIRHAGCAGRCCEADAGPVRRLEWPEDSANCEGCKGPLCEPPKLMDFDRSESCETHS